MMNGKGFARNCSSSYQAITRFVRILFIYSHLYIFYFIFVLCFLFSLAFQFLVPFFFLDSSFSLLPNSRPVAYMTEPPPLLSTPTVLLVNHIISTISMQHTLSFPRGSSSWTPLSWRRKPYDLSKRLELLTQIHGVTSRTTCIFFCSEIDWRVWGKTREKGSDSWCYGRNSNQTLCDYQPSGISTPSFLVT